MKKVYINISNDCTVKRGIIIEGSKLESMACENVVCGGLNCDDCILNDDGIHDLSGKVL